MSDARLRRVERQGHQGDPEAAWRVRRDRCRHGECCAHRDKAFGFLVPHQVLKTTAVDLWARRQALYVDLRLWPEGERGTEYAERIVAGLLAVGVVPSGTICTRVWEDRACRAVVLELCHESFPRVREGGMIPTVDWDDTTTTVELDLERRLSGPSWWVSLKQSGHL